MKTTTELKGENRINAFRKIAKQLALRMSSYEGVVGILFLGGLVRGFVDKFSDIDILVLLGARNHRLRKQLYDLGSATQRRFGTDVDLEAHFIEDFKKQRWGEIDKWEFSKVEIVYDPEGKVKEILEDKLRLPRDFWVKRVAECSEYLKWYCCPTRDDIGTIAEMWVERGDLLSAHYCLNYAVDLMVKIMFALNQEHLPAPKWRIFYSCSLKWQPKNYKRFIKAAMRTKTFSEEDLNLRLKALRKIWQSTTPAIEQQTGLTLDELSKYFVERVLGIRV